MPLNWIEQDYPLSFKIGPLRLGTIRLRAASLEYPFLKLGTDISIPALSREDFEGYEVALIPGHPYELTPPAVSLTNGLIRYVRNLEVRYLVDVRGTFREYLTKFSSKTRHNLTRSVQKFQELSGGRIQCRVFATAGEIETFYSVAIHISKKTYKGAMGRGFSEKPAFRKRLIEAAERGSVRGYVLYCVDDPVAYAFCRVEPSALVYEHIGYDPAYSRSSPGTVLLYLMIERLFEEKSFAHLDLMEGSYWHYKPMFATEQIPSAIMLYFPMGTRNLAIVTGHYAVRRLESALVRVKHALAAFWKRPPAG